MFGERPPADGVGVHRIDADRWQPILRTEQQRRTTQALEEGALILLPRLAFEIGEYERPHLSVACVRAGAKHVAFDTRTGKLRGATADPDEAAALRAMLQRYAAQSSALVQSLFPHYTSTLRVARTSFRPFETSGRVSSWRKDDRRLHVDAFPSSPNQGQRLLRVFSNVDPRGRNRVWNLGESFEAVASRFLPAIPRPWPGEAHVLRALRITRNLRTEYDHIMLQLHDRMKADDAYQASAVSAQLKLAAGSTWIVQTDCVSHAALSGQFMFEQTFLLPVEGMLDPARSPLRILERLAGRRLA